MDVSVCIVNWKTKDLLADCITSIMDRTSGVSYQIIVVDNNSSDGSVEMVKQEFPNCKLIVSKKNLGFSKGNNLGLREATGKYIFFLNPDTILKTNALYGMFQVLEAHENIGAVGCKLLNAVDSIQYTCARTYPTLLNQLCDLMLLNRLFPKFKLFSTIEIGYWDHLDSREIDCLSGACIFARKDIIDIIKGFDAHFFMYAEDVDLCYRIKKAGWKLYYLASEEIYHLEGQSSKKKRQKYFSAIAQRESNHYFFHKHFGKLYAWMYTIIIAFGSSFRILVIVLSTFVFWGDRITRQDREYIFLKYLNLLFWALGLRKLHDL